MSGLELNKIFASILLAALICMVVGNIAGILYHKDKKAKERGFSIAITQQDDASLEGKKEEEKIDIPTLMAKANADVGKDIFKKCLMCHTIEKGGHNKIGPDLWGVFGSNKAHRADYSYSSAMKAKGGVWDLQSLFAFLHKPKEFIPGTKMTFIGLKKPQEIADVIAFLKSQSDNPK